MTPIRLSRALAAGMQDEGLHSCDGSKEEGH